MSRRTAAYGDLKVVGQSGTGRCRRLRALRHPASPTGCLQLTCRTQRQERRHGFEVHTPGSLATAASSLAGAECLREEAVLPADGVIELGCVGDEQGCVVDYGQRYPVTATTGHGRQSTAAQGAHKAGPAAELGNFARSGIVDGRAHIEADSEAARSPQERLDEVAAAPVAVDPGPRPADLLPPRRKSTATRCPSPVGSDSNQGSLNPVSPATRVSISVMRESLG